MNQLFQRLGAQVFKNFIGDKLLGGVRRRVLMVYFKAVNVARRALMVTVLLAMLVQLMTIAFVGTVVTASYIWIHDEQLRLYVLFGAFATLFVVPLIAGCLILSERTWLRMSGAGYLLRTR